VSIVGLIGSCLKWCSVLQHTATTCGTLQHTGLIGSCLERCSVLQHTATHLMTLHDTAWRCNTLHHTRLWKKDEPRQCVCVYVCLYVSVCVCMCLYVSRCVCVKWYSGDPLAVCVCVCVCVCLYVSVCVCVSVKNAKKNLSTPRQYVRVSVSVCKMLL